MTTLSPWGTSWIFIVESQSTGAARTCEWFLLAASFNGQDAPASLLTDTQAKLGASRANRIAQAIGQRRVVRSRESRIASPELAPHGRAHHAQCGERRATEGSGREGVH